MTYSKRCGACTGTHPRFYQLPQLPQFPLGLGGGVADGGGSAVFQLKSATQYDVTIDCYERSGVVLGGDCEEANFQLIDGDSLLETGDTVAFPVLTSSSGALSAELALNCWCRWSSYPILVGHTLKITASEVEHDRYLPHLLNGVFSHDDAGSDARIGRTIGP